MKETWKSIDEFDGLYQISNFGNLLDCATGKIHTNIERKHMFVVYGKYIQRNVKTFLFDLFEFTEIHPDILNSQCKVESLEDEIWADIPEFEDFQVSNLGRVKSKMRISRGEGRQKRLISEKILRTTKIQKGYEQVKLTNDKGFLVHVLVAKLFIANPDRKSQVNHKDGNKTNNHVSNLEWSTPSENIRHSIDVLKNKHCAIGSRNKMAVINEDIALEIKRMISNKISVREIAVSFNITGDIVRSIKRNETWKHINLNNYESQDKENA